MNKSKVASESSLLDRYDDDFSANLLLHWLKEHPGIFGTIVLVLLTLFGAIYEVSLFSRFDLNIVKFARPTDFIFNWTRDYIALAYVGVALSVLLTSSIGVSLGKYLLRIFVQEAARTRIMLLLTVLAIVLFIPAATYQWLQPRMIASVVATGTILTTLNVFLAAIIRILLELTLGRQKQRPVAKLLLIFLFLGWNAGVAFDLTKAASDSHERIVRGEQENYHILVKDDTSISPATKLQLIGTTSQFYFFYEPFSKEAVVVPSANLTSLKRIPSEVLPDAK